MSNDVASIQGFWRFVLLRQHAYWNKRRGIRPFSSDPFIASHHVPNVFRELDRGTIFFQEWARQGELSTELLFYKAVVYRLINRKQTFEDFGRVPVPADFPDFEKHLYQIRDKDGVIFTGRHQTIGLTRLLQVFKTLKTRGPKIFEHLSYKTPNLEGAHWLLMNELPGVRGFFAWQILCDLLESNVFPKWSEDDWVYLGPGPIGAVQMMKERRLSQTDALKFVRSEVFPTQPVEGGEFPYPEYPTRFTLKNVEHSLCEYFRYIWYLYHQ